MRSGGQTGTGSEVTKDRSYSTSFEIADLESEEVPVAGFGVLTESATMSTTDSKPSTPDDGRSSSPLTVDDLDPVAGHIWAGIGFDTAKGKEKADSSSILVVFTNGTSGMDALDGSTVDAGDFEVVGNEVVSVIHPNKKRAIDKGRNDVGEEVSPHVDDDDDASTLANDDRGRCGSDLHRST